MGPGSDLRGRRLVAVFAHPDDESFGPGGTFARYAAAGVEMVLVCGTRGEAGSIGHSKSYGPDLLGRIRVAELEAATEVLGFRRLHLLGYPDRGVEGVAMEQGTEEVLAVLRQVEPEVVIAFHPSGISGHPDHRAMTAFAAAAVERLRGEGNDWRARLKLHYFTIPASVARQITYRELPLVPDEEISIELDTEAYAEVKRQAIHCHRTQLAFYERLVSMPGADGRFAVERYVTHGAPRRSRRGDDLFIDPDG
jgi:LmbE family N-acetylglucosaminyl deacetylase